MGLFSSLFGGHKPDDRQPSRDIKEIITPFLKPAVQVMASVENTNSYLGGLPKLADSIEWPQNKNGPLILLASIDLSEVSKAYMFDWLPKDGSLLFFYDLVDQPWGFDPKDAGGAQVVYVVSGGKERNPPIEMKGDLTLKKQFVSFRKLEIPPSSQRDELASLKLSDTEFDNLIEFQSELFGKRPQHQIGGYPDPIQGDCMELECQLVTNGIYCGKPEGYQSAAAKELAGGASEWRLLFQLDSDDDWDVMWGDVGRVYFWIREADASNKDFTRAWLILQCH